METLAVILKYPGVFILGILVRAALAMLVLSVIAAPIVAIVRVGEVLREWGSRWASAHGLW